MISCPFSVTLLHPNNTIKPDSKIGRTYFGIPKSGNNYVIFIIAKSKKHSEMLSIATTWGINHTNLLVGDGSSSSQYYGNHKTLKGYSNWFTTSRKVPHVIATKMKF